MPNVVRKILHFNRKIRNMNVGWREHLRANKQRADTEGQAFGKAFADHLEETTVGNEEEKHKYSSVDLVFLVSFI